MTRHTQIHETTRYEVIVRGVQSRAEAEAIVNAVEALPVGSAWISEFPPADPRQQAFMAALDKPSLDPATAAALETIGQADTDDAAPQMMDEEEARAR